MSTSASYYLFDTAIGTCAIAWTDAGVCGVSLPEPTAQETAARIRRRHPDAREAEPPEEIRAAADAIVNLLDGEAASLTEVALDESGIPEFHRRVYEVARLIPVGETSTYGAIANTLGDTRLAQQVGVALGSNPIPIIIPCHRVLGADGKLVGFSAPGGVQTKRRMLVIEGALPDEPLDLFE